MPVGSYPCPILLVLLVLTLPGCGESGPRPDYSLKGEGKDLLIKVPLATPNASLDRALQLPREYVVPPGAKVIVQGDYRKLDEKTSQLVIVEMVEYQQDNTRLICNAGIGGAQPADGEKYSYRVEALAPKEQKVYELEIKCGDQFLARGKLRVTAKDAN